MAMQEEQATEKTVDSAQETALVSRQQKWRWLPLASAGPYAQGWQSLNPLQCLPLRDIVRLSGRRPKALPAPAYQKRSHAVRESSDAAKVPTINEPGSSAAGEACPRAPSLKGTRVRDVRSGQAGEVVDEDLADPTLTYKVRFADDRHDWCPASNVSDLEQAPDQDGADSAACQAGASGAPAKPVAPEALDPVELDVGFARVVLKISQAYPKYGFCIEALDGILTRDGAMALLEYLDFTLRLPDVSDKGFVLTYDLRNCSVPQLDLVSWIMHYISDPEREATWHERCVCWKVVVHGGVYFKMAESVLSVLFTVCPPKCRVLLVTDVDTAKSESWVCFNAEDTAAEESNVFSTISSGFLGTIFPAFPNPDHGMSTSKGASFTAPVTAAQDAAPSREGSAANKNENLHTCAHENAVAKDDETETGKARSDAQQAADGTRSREHATSLKLPFANLKCGFDKSANLGYLYIQGLADLGGHVPDDGLQLIMNFMDDFINSSDAQQGFAITYDLRNLAIPSMSEIMRVAEWGNKPERQEKWTKLNTACKVVVSPGFKFSMCKAVLKSFFFICPPVCRTYLLTDPEEPEESATVFMPRQENASIFVSPGSSAAEDADSDGGNSSCGHPADASETTSATASNGDVCEDEAIAKLVKHVAEGAKFEAPTEDSASKPEEIAEACQSKAEPQASCHLRDPTPYALPQHFSVEHAWIFESPAEDGRCRWP